VLLNISYFIAPGSPYYFRMDDPSKRDGYEYSYIYRLWRYTTTGTYIQSCLFLSGFPFGVFRTVSIRVPSFGYSEWTDEWTIPQKGMKGLQYSTGTVRLYPVHSLRVPVLYFTIEPFLSGFPFGVDPSKRNGGTLPTVGCTVGCR
jgi:hypothetical protein